MKPEYIDIHAHLYFKDYDKDREEVIQKTIDNKIAVINVGTNLKTSKATLKLAEKYGHIYAVIGFHPLYADEIDAEDFKELEKMLKHPKCVGIGECGLDFSENREVNREKQKDIFIKQIALACEYKKPLMIHCREAQNHDDIGRAWDEVLEILKTYKNVEPDLKVNFHFFNQNKKLAKEIIETGFQYSFTGIITFVEDLKGVVKDAPIDKIMSETDSPYVAPKSKRGKRNEPNYVIEVVERITEVKGLPIEDVKKQLLKNAEEFFSLTF